MKRIIWILSGLTAAAIVTVFLWTEAIYGFRLFRKEAFEALSGGEEAQLLQAYDADSAEIAALAAVNEALKGLSGIEYRSAPGRRGNFMKNGSGMSLDYPDRTLILTEKYLAVLKKNRDGHIKGGPVIYRPAGDDGKQRAAEILSEFQPERSGPGAGGAVIPHKTEYPETALSVSSRKIPDSADTYLQTHRESVLLTVQTVASVNASYGGAAYDPESPVVFGNGFMVWKINGTNLSAGNKDVFYPARQNGRTLTWVILNPAPHTADGWTVSTNSEGLRVLNTMDADNGVIVYDRVGNCYYVNDHATLIEKTSISFRHGKNLVEIAKTRANAPDALRAAVGSSM